MVVVVVVVVVEVKVLVWGKLPLLHLNDISRHKSVYMRREDMSITYYYINAGLCRFLDGETLPWAHVLVTRIIQWRHGHVSARWSFVRSRKDGDGGGDGDFNGDAVGTGLALD